MKPRSLKPGATIGIVAPASNLKAEMLAAGVAELQRLGYRVRFRDDILEKHRYTAGSFERRLEELHQMWSDPEIDAIIAARGGYGCLPLLAHLETSWFHQSPKIFLGYSDITALHLYLWKTCGLVTFHGPMAAKDFAGGPDHYDLNSFQRLLEQTQPAGILTSPGLQTVIGGEATGTLVGGCLPLIVSLMGTPWQLETQDTILFLEDTAAKPFQIDRMLHHLKYGGVLHGIRGIVFGEMTQCVQHPQQGYRLEEVLYDILKELSVPILTGWRSGHSEQRNQTLPLGVLAKLDATRGTLEVLEPAVI